MTLKYCKVRNVKSPVRAHSDDAGIDFFVPRGIPENVFLEKCKITHCTPKYRVNDNGCISQIFLFPGQSVLIPSGIHVKLPKGYALIFMNKSGVASKQHLQVGACVVDENYEGECHINLTNIGETNIGINPDDKIVQGVIVPINYCNPEEVPTKEELYAGSISARGSGGFGSTGAN